MFGINETYNGWSNKETYDFVLMISNDFELYNKAQEIILKAELDRREFELLNKLGYLLGPDMNKVNYNEVISALIEE